VHNDGSRQSMNLAASGRNAEISVPDAASDVRYIEIRI
jgi:hypothetical protein